ncbi:MAG: sulfite exporter TauE/SafE family protein, partial [Candidatus Latescibacteria bacterium]|nr:sulfite exporter TauE/SafE family protein [Candidatus Latescibacterota bacterium]
MEPQRLTVDAACLRDYKWVYWALPLAVGSGAALLFQDLQSPLAPRLALGLLCGAVVGFSLGLTGGGGSIFAVPLLVYGLDVAPREAVGISLAAVGATALLGAIQRLRAREVEIGIGLLFAVGGVLGAPVGSWLGRQLSADVLLLLFAGLMAFVAARMWSRAIRRPEETR